MRSTEGMVDGTEQADDTVAVCLFFVSTEVGNLRHVFLDPPSLCGSTGRLHEPALRG